MGGRGDTHRCIECWSCWGKLTFYQKSSKVRQGIVTDDLCKFFFFFAYPRCTHTHFIFHSLSCPPGSHQTFSVKPSFLLPPVEFTLLLLFAESLSCAALFWHWKVHLCFLGLYCFNVSAACLSNLLFLFFFKRKQKPPGRRSSGVCWFTECNHVYQTGFCLPSDLLPLHERSLPPVFILSLHISASSSFYSPTETDTGACHSAPSPPTATSDSLWSCYWILWNWLKTHPQKWTMMERIAVFLSSFIVQIRMHLS